MKGQPTGPGTAVAVLGALALCLAALPFFACSSQTVISRSSCLSIPEEPAAPVEQQPPARMDEPVAAKEEPSPPPASPAPAAEPAAPVAAPPDLAAWAREKEPIGIQTPVQPADGLHDDFDELITPFDEKIIAEIMKERQQVGQAIPEAAPSREAPVETALVPPAAPETAGEAPPPQTPQPEGVVYDFPIEFNSQVLAYVELFKTVRRESFERGLVRSRIYEQQMKRILAEEGVPVDLYYLCLIESAFNPKAYSRARAMGPWQFIESTGRVYGLTRDWWLDERRDIDKSTRAAARHLKDLYAELNSWPLALASYNAGINYVKRVCAQMKTTDFWSLRLVSQTKSYVPAYMAATIIAKEPEKHDFLMEYDPPQEYDRVAVDECTDLEVIANCAGTTVAVIKELNPELMRWCTPPGMKNYQVAVPKGSADRFREQYALVPKERKVSWNRYQIAQGDTLSGISRKFGTSVEAVAQVNNLKRTLIRAGDYLLIPVPQSQASLTEAEKRKITSQFNPERTEGSGAAKLSYRVRPGDNLWLISQRHDVTVEALRSWNPGLTSDLLQTGDLLTVWSREAGEAGPAQPAVKPGDNFTYLVKKGDTLWGIAYRFGKDVQEICRANGFNQHRTLYPGDPITIPGSDL